MNSLVVFGVEGLITVQEFQREAVTTAQLVSLENGGFLLKGFLDAAGRPENVGE